MINYETLIKRYAPSSLEVIEQFSSLIEGESQESQWDAYSMLVEQILPSYEFDVITVDDRGKEIERKKGKAHYFTEDLGDGVGLDMVYIPGGEAVVGSEKAQEEEIDVSYPTTFILRETGAYEHHALYLDKPCKIGANPFFMSKYPITIEQWDMVTKKSQCKSLLKAKKIRLKLYGGKKSEPMSSIRREQIIDFCQYLSQKTGILFRVPTPSEWEYACRAGTKTLYYFGDTITTSLANFNNDRKTPVGSFPPNKFGLYDLHGNVYEWCGEREYSKMQIYPDIINPEIYPNFINLKDNLINLDYEARSLVEIENFFHDIQLNMHCIYVAFRGGGYSSQKKDCQSSSIFRKIGHSYGKDVGFRLICG